MLEPKTQRRPRTASDHAGGIRVLYIGGWGRSGSTVLGRLLGRVPGMIFAGELNHLWQRGLAEDRLCGCGEAFSRCEHWRAAGEAAYAGWGNVDLAQALAAGPEGARHRQVPGLLGIGRDQALEQRAALLLGLYRGLSVVGGGATIVDSSKSPPYAMLLGGVPGLDLRVVHLVRDGRAVAYSWAKKVERPDQPGAFMPRFGTASSALYWLTDNWLFHLMQRRGVAVLRVRYEDLVREPDRWLAAILAHAGHEHRSERLEEVAAGVDLGTDHTVAGNPMRFARGPVHVRLDDEWRTRMPARRRAVFTAIGWPLLARYGYLARGVRHEE